MLYCVLAHNTFIYLNSAIFMYLKYNLICSTTANGGSLGSLVDEERS